MVGAHMDEEGGGIAVGGEDVLVGVGWGGRSNSSFVTKNLETYHHAPAQWPLPPWQVWNRLYVLDPFFPSRSLSQVLNLMDQMMENPFAALSRGMGGGSRMGFDVREDMDTLYLRVDMLGFQM
ncbi:hypothetical protein MRB53_002141 [Persea americana]|uniref:Uncharacterized protein n=1 Tax=Persea americana TaxID=3435 RepID=A0ACC2MU04_PERAE|nr:hypothetical protein MRB53_002141 [Persea americana]